MVNLTHTAHQRDHCISMTMKNMCTHVIHVLFCSAGSLLHFSAQWTCSQYECECEELNLLKHGNRLQQHQCWAESRLVLCGCWGLSNLAPDSLWASEPWNCSLLPDLTLTQARLSASSHKTLPSPGNRIMLCEDTRQQNKQTHRTRAWTFLLEVNKWYVLSRITWLDEIIFRMDGVI